MKGDAEVMLAHLNEKDQTALFNTVKQNERDA